MTDKLTVYTLYSGSSGNCVYISSAKTRIIIDAGCSARTLETSLRAVGGDLSRLDAVFVTHGHTDHVNALATLMKRTHLPVHMCADTANWLRGKFDYVVDTIVEHPREYEYTVGDLTVASFPTPHDSPGRVGYVVTADGETLGVATDMGCVTRGIYDRLARCDRLIIESNYDEDMLRHGHYTPDLKARILSDHGHLSNADCARLVSALAGEGVRSFLLAHLSRDNNTPERALAASCSALSQAGRTDVLISVADRFCPTYFE